MSEPDEWAFCWKCKTPYSMADLRVYQATSVGSVIYICGWHWNRLKKNAA